MEDAYATSPYLETLPYVGLNPYIPQNAAGCLIDPPVSDPKDIGVILAQTAAALPPDDPPGTDFRSQGFLVGKKAECSVEDPIANSSKLVFPMIIASSSSKFFTIVALKGAL